MPAFIDPSSIQVLDDFLCDGTRIGLDTEFMRESTFFPELCLVQLAIDDAIHLVDPIDKADLDEFWKRLAACHWVVHSARQDIEVLYHASKLLPSNIFDTQIAAGLLGLTPQIGYGGLVDELFGVTLAKSHTRTDWAKRPLPAAALAYAAEDVEYLLPAYDILARKLARAGRLGWAEEDSIALLRPSLYEANVADAINRLRGGRNLRGRARAAAVKLASWREHAALRSNRPRQWIMKDAVLLDIATAGPADIKALAAISGLPPRTLRKAGNTLLEIIGSARRDEAHYEPPQKPDETQIGLLKKLQTMVSECAAKLGIAAEIIAPRKELSAAVFGDRNLRMFSGWRRELIGEKLLNALESQ